MKSKLIRRGLGLLTASGLVAAGALGVAPAQAVTKTTLIIGDGLGWSSLNTANPDENSAINADVAYLTGGPGFWYYDNKPSQVLNTKFGSFKVLTNKTGNFTVQYTINKGLVWSDGTPIDAVDMLLSHVVSSSVYSKAAGLGDPNNADVAPTFYSGGYGGSYDNHVVGVPVISADHMSLTIKYDQYLSDWKVSTPGLWPVHALEQLAAGKTTAQGAAANTAAKALFLKDFSAAVATTASAAKTAAQARMAAMGDKWTNSYNFDSSNYDGSNTLINIAAGPFKLSTYDHTTATVTLVRNSKYNSGPALATKNPVQTVVFKYVQDGTASVQALQNGDINLYQGNPGAAGLSTLQTLDTAGSINLDGGTSATYEHIDLRAGDGAGAPGTYRGLFAFGTKGKDLRLAFLLAFPRFATMTNQLKPYNSKATLLNSNFTLPGSIYYAATTKGSGILDNKTYTIGGTKYTYNFNVTSAAQQTANEALALKIVQKYYPNAGDGVDTAALHVNLLRSGRQMRVENNAVIVAHEGNAGFTVTNRTTAGWSAKLSLNEFDAEEFAWVPNAIAPTTSNAQYLSDGGNNHMGWNDAGVDDLLHKLEGPLSDAQIGAIYGQAEKIIINNSWTLPMYQWPQVTAYSKSVYNVKGSSISPTYAWNYWEWHF